VDPNIIVAVITAAGLVIGGWLGYLGVRFTQRQAAEVAEDHDRREQEKEHNAAYAAAYGSARETWDEHVDSLREQVADLREEMQRLASEAATLRENARELRARVDELETGRDLDRTRIRELTTWARDVLRILAEHGIAYPPPPPGLEREG
jgi:chromosome segregation ATPase